MLYIVMCVYVYFVCDAFKIKCGNVAKLFRK